MMVGWQRVGAAVLPVRREDQVAANRLLRRLAALLDVDTLRQQLEPSSGEIGRPSVDPELMIRMLLIGYSIRAERRRCDAAAPFDVSGQPPWPLP